jgi:hypothetical protein
MPAVTTPMNTAIRPGLSTCRRMIGSRVARRDRMEEASRSDTRAQGSQPTHGMAQVTER